MVKFSIYLNRRVFVMIIPHFSHLLQFWIYGNAFDKSSIFHTGVLTTYILALSCPSFWKKYSIFDFGTIHFCIWGCHSKIQNQLANSVDTDETACNEPSHLALHCLQTHMFWSVKLKELVISLFGLITEYYLLFTKRYIRFTRERCSLFKLEAINWHFQQTVTRNVTTHSKH